MSCYERAQRIYRENIKEIISDGKEEDGNWIFEIFGDFISINLNNGEWFKDEERFEDIIGLYAWLNLTSLFKKTKDKKEQLSLAAREILAKYDYDYFPDSKDKFTAPENSGFFDRELELQKLEEPKYIDDGYPFKILGTSSENIYFFPEEALQVLKYSKAGLNKGKLMTLCDRKWWGECYAKEGGGIGWDGAANDILRSAHKKGIYDSSMIRGAGAWKDGRKIVIHTGDNTIVDGVVTGLYEASGQHVYEKRKRIPYSARNALKKESSGKLIDIMNLCNWSNKESPYLLAGWLLLAPFGGCLDWRPHGWLTGRTGSGKSWVLDNIIYKIIGDFGVIGLGSSTTAGIRQETNNSTIPVILDEFESDTEKQREKIEEVLTLFRQSSSGGSDGAQILHGSTDGIGVSWKFFSMGLFTSIGATIKHTADKTRITLYNLDSSNSKDESLRAKFKKLEKESCIFTKIWSRSFYARVLSILPEVLKCVDVFKNLCSKITGNARKGDQIGTQFAGAYMIDHDISATAQEANEWLSQFDINSVSECSDDKTDEELIVDEILTYQIDFPDVYGMRKIPIGTALKCYFKIENDEDTEVDISHTDIKRLLTDVGIKPFRKNQQMFIDIASSHPGLKKVLHRSPWEFSYFDLLQRLDSFSTVMTGGRFGSIKSRFLRLNALEILDETPF